MTDGMQMVEIIFLAMLAGFIALRLVSVLGRRTGNEKPVTDGYSGQQEQGRVSQGSPRKAHTRGPVEIPVNVGADTATALRRIAEADESFDPQQFIDGAQSAYGLILEAFWAGDLEALKPFVSDDVYDQFERAVAMRKEEGLTLENRLIGIDRAELVAAELNNAMAEITVRFDAHLAAVTRNKAGDVVEGSVSDSIETHDVWTFSRHIGATDPNWLLIATDAD